MTNLERCATCKYYDYIASRGNQFGVCRMMTHGTDERVKVVSGGGHTVIVKGDHYCSAYTPQ